MSIKYPFLFFVMLCVFSFQGKAQINLVLNPDFEQFSHCPNAWDQVKYAIYWNGIDSTWSPMDTTATPPCLPDYDNICSSFYPCSIPSNIYFRQFPHSGNGMVQVQMYYNEESATAQIKRDYLQGRFKNTLVAGHQYCVSFYTVLEQGSAYAIDHFGAYLDNGTIDTTTNCGWPQTTHIPQIFVPSLITDTLNWTKIQGTFTATGDEKFVTIGNFSDANHTDTIREYFSMSYSILNTQYAWYLIDDVSVIDLSSVANAGHDTTLLHIGDSCWVGNHDGYLPCRWYKNGVLIDSNVAGFWVHPATSCYYVMALDVCGTVTSDTMRIQVGNVGLVELGALNAGVRVFPNPASNDVCVSGLMQNTPYQLQAVDGSVAGKGILKMGVDKIFLGGLRSGVFLLVLYGDSGERCVKRIVKE